jgi:hypothetical protein
VDVTGMIVGYDPTFPVDRLHRYHRNPRRGDVPTIRQSLATTGQYRPLVVNQGTITGRPDEILAGNHTYEAALPGGKVLDERGKAVDWKGLPTLAVTFVDCDEETARRIVVIDNRAADKATNDADMLAGLLVDMDDLIGSGYSEDDLAKMLEAQGPAPDDSALLGDQQFSILVACENETHQLELLSELEEQGLSVKAMVT